MKLDIQSVFCEVIGGLGLIALIAGILVLTGNSSVATLTDRVVDGGGGLELAGVLVAAYVAGVVVDAAGLVLDEYVLYRLADRSATEAERRLFFQKVSAHVLEWRTNVWNYYFCFRNLLLLAVPNALVWTVVASRASWLAGAVTFILIGSVAVVLAVASKILLDLYQKVTITVGS